MMNTRMRRIQLILFVLLVATSIVAVAHVVALWQTWEALPAPTPTITPPLPLIRAQLLPHIDRKTPATPTPRPQPTPSPSPTPSPTPTPTPWPTPDPHLVRVAQEHGINTQGRYIIVDQAEQRMYIVEGDRLIRVLPISSGDPQRGFFTPAWVGRVGVYWGTFSARGVYADEAWHLFQAPGGNILIHGLPYTLDPSGRKIYQDVNAVGRTPASRGCIRLFPQDAVWFTHWNPAGVPIVILPHPAQGSTP